MYFLLFTKASVLAKSSEKLYLLTFINRDKFLRNNAKTKMIYISRGGLDKQRAYGSLHRIIKFS